MRAVLHSRPVLLVAFAFAVMADPVSSVAYAIEAALRALGGDLGLLLTTMGLVVAIIGVIIVNYQQLVARYPQGGGAAAAAGEAFGEAWAFIPIGALIVDFVLTIAISVSAGASAIIAYLPGAAPWRLPLALGLIVLVGGITWFGHLGRAFFAVLTVLFIVFGVVVVIGAFTTGAHPTGTSTGQAPHSPPLAVALAFPVAMALATGVEAPSSAIAQLGQLDDTGRRRFGRITLWLTLGIVGGLTLGLTAAAVHLGAGVPAAESTQLADLAQVATSPPVFALFQGATALLLLSAASSSFQAGPGLLKALARRAGASGKGVGILPSFLGRTNTHHTPYWGVAVFVLISAGVTAGAGGRDQELVLFYAVAVFISFLAGLVAMAHFSRRDRAHGWLAVNLFGALVVAFTLVVNLARGEPLVSLAASLIIAGVLHRVWVRAGRPRGIAHAAVEAEAPYSEPVED
ncbi:APC family permease [Rhodococcus opacus]|uniref:amino acid permease n=1 Tax=Rhodococcus opacus TaxID=37919 RepID=UPI00223667A9|nr:amino acid permease [Rhodococcus opacus]UZG60465.1 amino acid permease [Rhodococcus opacus]